MRRVLIFVFVVALWGCASDDPTSSDPPVVGSAGDGTLDDALESIRFANALPGLAGAMVRSGKLVEFEAVGFRAVGFDTTVTTGDSWHIGSLTKSMTSTLAGILVEDETISWETTVGEVFPDLVGKIREAYVDVRLDELLYHTAGLPVDVTLAPIWASLIDDPAPLPDQRRRFAAELLAIAPEGPRGDYLYTNAGYVVAGSMIEEVTGETWEALMQRELFDALGMNDTGFGAPGVAGEPDQPWGHLPTIEGWFPVEPGPGADNPAALGPAGTVHTTIEDYAQYMTAHLAGARGEGGLVTAETFEKLQTPAPDTNYALGWGIFESEIGRAIAHDGSNLRWYAIVWIAPERDVALFTVTNAGGSRAANGAIAALNMLLARFDAAYGNPANVAREREMTTVPKIYELGTPDHGMIRRK